MSDRLDQLALLAVPSGQLGSLSKPRRGDAILEAKSWPSGISRQDQVFTQVSPDLGRYHVSLGKPGKESEPGYGGKPNPNDMTPTVFLDSQWHAPGSASAELLGSQAFRGLGIVAV